MRESQVEKYLVDRVKECGGIAEKFTSPGRKNVPDRLITWPGPKYHFVEVKRPGEDATDAQLRDHKRRRKMGCVVHVVNTLERVDRYIHLCRVERLTYEK